MTAPDWALTLAYWLHMLATVVWIGGLAALSLLILPAARKTLDHAEYAVLLGDLQRRLDPLGWFSLAILAATGLFQMSASPSYQGFLSIQNSWAAAILVKHLLFLMMGGISGYLTWVLTPRLRRVALLQARSREAESTDKERSLHETTALQRQEAFLLRVNLILGVLVLALTALARSS